VKFNDADLIGVPLRVGIGRRHVGPGTVEWKLRADSQVETLPVAELLARARATVAGSFS
jgi:prolyl-tRNA synthetase